MAFTVRSLASGSSGNATLVTLHGQDAQTSLLIDAGVSQHLLNKHLAAFGVPMESLRGIVVTHEHDDHVRSAHALSRRHGIPLVANAETLGQLYRGKTETPHIVLPTGDLWEVAGIAIETFAIPHDAVAPVGVNLTARAPEGAKKISYITDVGTVTEGIRRAIRGADLLILEANHDVYRLHAGPYPEGMKRRILSQTGHLSNEDAVKLMLEHLDQKGPCTFWLAHLSKINNLPKLALNYARATLKLEARCPFAIEVALRDKPSAVWSPGATALQLNLF